MGRPAEQAGQCRSDWGRLGQAGQVGQVELGGVTWRGGQNGRVENRIYVFVYGNVAGDGRLKAATLLAVVIPWQYARKNPQGYGFERAELRGLRAAAWFCGSGAGVALFRLCGHAQKQGQVLQKRVCQAQGSMRPLSSMI